MKKNKRHVIKLGLVLAFMIFIIWAIKLDCPNQAYGQFQTPPLTWGWSDSTTVHDTADVLRAEMGDTARTAVGDSASLFLRLAGGTMTGAIDMGEQLLIGGTATTSNLTFKVTTGVGVTDSGMHFLVGNNGATEAMTILNNGYVGIGINSPSSILHVKASVPGVIGSHSAGQLIIQNPANSVYANAVITGYESDGGGNPDQQLWYLGGSSGSNSDVTLLNRRNSKLHLGADGATKMTILGDGNVGIGTLNPPERLSVVGNTATGDTTTGDVDVFHYFSTDASWVTEYLKWDDGAGGFHLSDDLLLFGGITGTSANINGLVDISGKLIVDDTSSLNYIKVLQSLKLFSHHNPILTLTGEMAWDANDSALKVYTGNISKIIPSEDKFEALIWAPDGITDTIPLFYVDSTLYPGGIKIVSAELQTSIDGAYALNLYEFTGADLPVFSAHIDTLNIGASDQRVQSVTFTDSDIAQGAIIYINTPATDIDWVRISVRFYVKENN